jgi:hypothetical protein
MPWNTIDVPLETGWQCTLMPAPQYDGMMRWGRGYHDLSARRLYPRADRDDRYSTWNARAPSEVERAERWERNRIRQLADDQADFARFFRPAWDLRTMTGGDALRDIKTFLRDSLNIVHWNMPEEDADIRRILCKAVADARLIPIIDREYKGLPRVRLPDPAPQRWPTTGGGGGYTFPQKVIGYDEFVALQRANGELADSLATMASPGVSAVIEPLQNLGTVSSSGADGRGFDWPGAVETVADAMFGDGDDPADGDSAQGEEFSGGASDDATPLGNAQAFGYDGGEDAGGIGDGLQTAWLPSTGGPPDEWVENTSGKKQWRLYDGNGDAAVDIDFGHDHGFGVPHAHNWDDGVRDNGNAVSLLPF